MPRSNVAEASRHHFPLYFDQIRRLRSTIYKKGTVHSVPFFVVQIGRGGCGRRQKRRPTRREKAKKTAENAAAFFRGEVGVRFLRSCGGLMRRRGKRLRRSHVPPRARGFGEAIAAPLSEGGLFICRAQEIRRRKPLFRSLRGYPSPSSCRRRRKFWGRRDIR